MSETKFQPCLYVQVEESYGSYYVRAYVGYMTEQGEIHNVSWRDRYGDTNVAPELDGFRIRAFLGNAHGLSSLDAERGIWGWGVEYDVHTIDDPKQAQAIARVLTKVETGIKKINDAEGWLEGTRPGAFTGYITRIARVLKIKELYVRNAQEKLWATTGTPWKKVDGSGLQYWIYDVDARAKDDQRYSMVHPG